MYDVRGLYDYVDGVESSSGGSLSMSDDALVQRIADAVRESDPGAEVFLYGSRARGRAAPESDWDILVLSSVPATDDLKREIRHRVYSIEWDTGQVITCIVHSRVEWRGYPLRETPFHRRVSREAIRV